MQENIRKVCVDQIDPRKRDSIFYIILLIQGGNCPVTL
jgi:hypothetical protein